LKDLDTKMGTLVNGEQIRGTTIVLQRDHNVAFLAKSKCQLTYEYWSRPSYQLLTPPRFTWIPVSLTFSFGVKEAKADPYSALYELLGPLDIKVLIDYQPGLTTHLVAKRRNTPKGLQALIDSRFIVNHDSFVNAIVAAATPALSEDVANAKSSLEVDWDANFPDPLKYLPPRGEEPTERDDTAYAPNPGRQAVFEGYTFIFYEKRQFDTLHVPISEGGGKALFREVIPRDTDVQDFVRYVKSVAGEKGLGEFEDGSEGKGVVVVRFNPVKGSGTEWFADFNRQVALYLDHRLIEQNEFLDAILGNDASGLRRPLEVEPSASMEPPPTASMSIP
jgi:nijmegen breakage syndrome protein 1